MSLVHQMLLLLEAMPVTVGAGVLFKRGAEEIEIPGYGVDQIKFHFALLRNAGFVNVVAIEPTASLRFRGLTWSGHDFLDRARQRESSERTDAAEEMDPNLMPTTPYASQRRVRTPNGIEAALAYPRKALRNRA